KKRWKRYMYTPTLIIRRCTAPKEGAATFRVSAPDPRPESKRETRNPKLGAKLSTYPTRPLACDRNCRCSGAARGSSRRATSPHTPCSTRALALRHRAVGAYPAHGPDGHAFSGRGSVTAAQSGYKPLGYSSPDSCEASHT